MTADEARDLALYHLEESRKLTYTQEDRTRAVARAQVYATLALSLAEAPTIKASPSPSQVRPYLELSTAHLPFHVMNGPLNSFEGVIAYKKMIGADDFGAWLWVPENPQDEADGSDYFPDEVLAVQLYARSLGCDWVMFDSDADSIDELARWVW